MIQKSYFRCTLWVFILSNFFFPMGEMERVTFMKSWSVILTPRQWISRFVHPGSDAFVFFIFLYILIILYSLGICWINRLWTFHARRFAYLAEISHLDYIFWILTHFRFGLILWIGLKIESQPMYNVLVSRVVYSCDFFLFSSLNHPSDIILL